MRLTNIYNYPQWYVDMVSGFLYDPTDGGRRRSDCSATRSINPLQQIVLTRRYGDSVAVDVSDMTWIILGQAAHSACYHAQTRSINRLKRAAKLAGEPEPEDLPALEDRLYVPIVTEHGVFTYSGQPDRICFDHTVRDLKVTSAWKLVFDKEHREWQRQLSIYNAMGYAYGLPVVDKGQICAILKDWQKSKAEDSPDYPQANVQFLDFELASPDTTFKWLQQRAEEIADAMELGDDELPPCTAEEIWAKDEKWAVYKDEKSKQAMRGGVCDTQEQAEAKLEAIKADCPGAYVEHRPGRHIRCDFDPDLWAKHGIVSPGYCKIAPFCKQHQEYLAEQGLEVPEPAEPVLVS